ncbi:membrane protein [Streptomyces sp. NRRL S-455]|uniref:SCO2102 family sporulation regulator n=1 Tax=Streptomyces sp. NRRL S-455 TaxID=1463908 RepID=UPI0004BF0B41|nr:membrane protein [Streptomyces sp. NRRL S-455]
MGWTVLYIAFGVVALWLLGEVLLQYKARLRWRLLAFAGFLGVVIGVLIPSVVVIGLGAAAFAVGQTYVTLSFRSGFSAGWAMNAPVLGGSKRRRGERGRQEPTLEVSGLEAADGGYADEAAYRRDTAAHGQDDDYDRDDVFSPARSSRATDAETTAVYEPQPVPEDTGSYGVYGDTGYHSGSSHDQYAATAQGSDQSYAYDYPGYGQQESYDATGQQQYAAYSDPYIGTGTYGSGSYDTGYGDQQYYGQQGYGQDQYAGTYGGESPPGGVWVPQQRDTDEYGQELPPEQSYPYQGQQAQGNGFDEQYRF